MKPIKITITTTIDEEIDQALYGKYYAFSRYDPEHPWENRPFVKIEKGGVWVPIKDWKNGLYIITDGQLREIARHFIEVGKRLSGLIDPAELREEIDRRMTENCALGTETGGARAVEDNDILAVIDRILEER